MTDEVLIKKLSTLANIDENSVSKIFESLPQALGEILSEKKIVHTSVSSYVGITWPEVTQTNPETGASLTIPKRNDIEVKASSNLRKNVKNAEGFFGRSSEAFRLNLAYKEATAPKENI